MGNNNFSLKTKLIFHLRIILRRTPLFPKLHHYKQRKLIQEWIEGGKSTPPPHLLKQTTIIEFARKSNVHTLVETGTFLGDMIGAVEGNFDEIYSIELSEFLYKISCKRFSHTDHIHLHFGDSGEILGELINTIDKPCLFWLDGHYSAGFTAKGSLETPILRELTHISHHPYHEKDIILIDDARCFTGEGDYPGIQVLEEWAGVNGYDRFEVQDDIIRIYRT
jgi:hypothetical protein